MEGLLKTWNASTFAAKDTYSFKTLRTTICFLFFFFPFSLFSFQYLMNYVPDSCPCRGQQRASLLVKWFVCHPNEILRPIIPCSGYQVLARPQEPPRSSELTHHPSEYAAAAQPWVHFPSQLSWWPGCTSKPWLCCLISPRVHQQNV